MTRGTGALVAASAAATVVVEWAVGLHGIAAVADGAAALSLLLGAIVARPRSRGYALVSAAAGIAWLVGGLLPGVLWLHRPLVVWAAVSFPTGRLRRRSATLLVVGAAILAIPGPATSTGAMATVGAALVVWGAVELRRSRLWPDGAGRARGGATVWTGLALMVPAADWLNTQAGGPVIPAPLLEVAYAGLVAVAAATLLFGAWDRSRTDVDAVISLAESGDAESTLAEMRGRAQAIDDPERRRAMDAAIALLERNVESQKDLAAAVEQSRLSRRRLVNVTVVERHALRRRLSERVLPLLPEIELTLGHVTTDDPRAEELLMRCRAELEGIREDLAALADGLHPARLGEIGLAAVAEAMSTGPMPVEVHLPDARYPAECEAAIWYACAEAVTNAAKHGNATRVLVDGQDEGGWLTVQIRDDGIGGAAVDGVGGLAGLADRLAALDGTIAVDSEAGRGTTVRLAVPVR